MYSMKSYLKLVCVSLALGFAGSLAVTDELSGVVTGPYFGQELPGMTAELFAPGVISTDRREILLFLQ